MTSTSRDAGDHTDEIRLWREDGWWIAQDVETGVTTHGESRESALSNLDEAVALYRGEIGHEPTEDELRELGIRPEDNTTDDNALPDWLE